MEDGVLYRLARSSAERAETANVCVTRLAVKLPALLDGMDNRVERLYTGWPDRLYIINTDGRIHYKSNPGPFGFSTKDLEASLENLLNASS